MQRRPERPDYASNEVGLLEASGNRKEKETLQERRSREVPWYGKEPLGFWKGVPGAENYSSEDFGNVTKDAKSAERREHFHCPLLFNCIFHRLVVHWLLPSSWLWDSIPHL